MEIMEWISALVLALVQGILEWFPVSSSGHLVLVQSTLDYESSLFFSVALHFGTLMAVFVYFGKDIIDIIRDLLSLKFQTDAGRLGVLLLIAAIPTALAGVILQRFVEEALGSLLLLALGFGITSLILFFGAAAPQKLDKLSWKGALLIGCVQILSLFRGVSRSGSTIVAGLWLGLKEKEAVKFSYLLSIPLIFGANLVLVGSHTLPTELLWATLVAFGVSLLVMHVSFTYVLNDRKNLRWLAVYTLILALSLGVYAIY